MHYNFETFINFYFLGSVSPSEMSSCNHLSDQDKELAIISAAQHGHQECIESLVQAGADVNATDHFGNTALKNAVQNEHLDCVNSLIKAGANVNTASLFAAIDSGHMDCIDLLIKAGADVNGYGDLGFTPLMVAAIRDDKELAMYFIEKGADVNLT